MSKQNNEILEEEVVVNEVEAKELVEEKEAKKAKMMNIGKKALKVAGVAAVGFLGYFLGTKASKNSEYDYSEIPEEVETENE